jgi:hypothetical protein
MTQDEIYDLMDKLLDENRLHNLEFEWDEIANLTKPLAAMLIGLAIIDNNFYSICPENHIHIYLFTPTPRTESDSDETAQVLH